MSSNRQQSMGDPASQPDLLIAGASARAAAASAIRARFHVATADRFADTDLREIADAKWIFDWPEGILDWTRNYPSNIPFAYVGGLENAPDVLDRVAQDRSMAGISGNLLRELRDPLRLGDWCRRHGFRFPRLVLPGSTLAERILVKPVRSVAGLGIRDFDGTPISSDEYLQEFIAGSSVSAAYIITARSAELLGTFQQFPPEPNDLPTQSPFLYRGSISRTLRFRDRLDEIGHALQLLGVRGLCGVDFIETGTGELVLLEINPRYTASMELCEQRTGRALIGEHLACFGAFVPQSKNEGLLQNPLDHYRGKRIVFAACRLIWRIPPPEILPALPDGTRWLADIPPTGAQIEPRDPICTLFAMADTFDECRRELLRREQRLLTFLETDPA